MRVSDPVDGSRTYRDLSLEMMCKFWRISRLASSAGHRWLPSRTDSSNAKSFQALHQVQVVQVTGVIVEVRLSVRGHAKAIDYRNTGRIHWGDFLPKRHAAVAQFNLHDFGM